jgi:hypothetical protein
LGGPIGWSVLIAFKNKRTKDIVAMQTATAATAVASATLARSVAWGSALLGRHVEEISAWAITCAILITEGIEPLKKGVTRVLY